ncbi:MAG: Eco57I restriction-modification methylase domain-containing protein [Paludibacteraceae bacterium]|nr:Eco57I restriction-modification methylase domain-containing protein [Paludibacteraceae bacterium]
MKYTSALNAKLIYVFAIDDEQHKGALKIGEATLYDNANFFQLAPNCKELNDAAKERIDQYTKTAGITYKLLHTEVTIYFSEGKVCSFSDKEVHNVLQRSGINRHDFGKKMGSEWYDCNLETAKKAIEAVKAGKTALDGVVVTTGQDYSLIELRPEQKAAVALAKSRFAKKTKKVLWNAKMRFGKTLSAHQLIKEMEVKRTIIITHRPVVDGSWFEDFSKIFFEKDTNWHYGSVNKGFSFEEMERNAKRNADYKYIYFASIQDLRGSEDVGGKFDKNNEVFSVDWDLLIIDEAHEGTRTELGQSVIEAISKENTCQLHLSGTPFNISHEFSPEDVYTWDYVMEQRAKQQWEIDHFGAPNPYAGLPKMNIFTYELEAILGNYEDIEDKAFNFKEFFRVHTSGDREGKFVHEDDVKRFLDILATYAPETNFPFCNENNRKNFRHSLWMVPGVKEAKALSELLRSHATFQNFNIANVAGDGDEDVENQEALGLVRSAITDKPHEAYSITLSCGKLTTGVSVPEWTAVLMLAGSKTTDAKAYMQTIFRVQTPYTDAQGRRKEDCFVFDFAPDRTLIVLSEVASISRKRGQSVSQSSRDIMTEFLNFCPILGYNGNKMKAYDANSMVEHLKKAQVERVVRGGFEDAGLYDNEMLLKLDSGALSKFEGLKRIIGSTKANKSTGELDINDQGLDKEKRSDDEGKEKKSKKQESEEDKKKKKNRDAAVSILRGISIRMPMLIYGAKLPKDRQDIDIEEFADLVDDESWKEFMPKDVTKEIFADFIQYYDKDIFRAAGRKIRDIALAADRLNPTERVQQIARLFSYFRNPDKETVLTPWRVVNMHMSYCLGGQCFWNEDFKKEIDSPRLVEHENVTKDVFAPNSRILEINSKTGLYPLYVAYSIFATRIKEYRCSNNLTGEVPQTKQTEIWNDVLANNVFVLCKTEMAKSITCRTLRGFTDAKVRAHHFDDLINQIKNRSLNVVEKVSRPSFWNLNGNEIMKFNAIVGNPPYQEMDGAGAANSSSAKPIYNLFVDFSKKLEPNYVSLIMPAKWYSGGKGLKSFRRSMLNDFRIKKLFDFEDEHDCFDKVDIAGGVCYFLWDINYQGLCKVTNHYHNELYVRDRALNDFPVFVRNGKSVDIINKILGETNRTFSEIVSSTNPFGFGSDYEGLASAPNNYLNLYTKNGYRFVANESVIVLRDKIGDWKLIISAAASEHAGQTDKNGRKRIVSKIESLPPDTVCTGTYLLLNTFQTELECENMKKYIKTCFCRFLLATVVLTQHIAKDSFRFVPLQDFTSSSDINWSLSIPEIDQQLYKKYGLSDDEIAFIEKMIKPM